MKRNVPHLSDTSPPFKPHNCKDATHLFSRSRRCKNLIGVCNRTPPLTSKKLLPLLLLAPQALCLLLALLLDVGCISERGEADDRHEGYAEGGAADEDPAEAFDV